MPVILIRGATGVVCRVFLYVWCCVSLKVIILFVFRGRDQTRTVGFSCLECVWSTITNGGYAFDYFTANVPIHKRNQAAIRTRFARDPVIDIGFDQEFVAYVFPEWEFHGIVLGLTQRNRFRSRDAYARCRPRGEWCDSIARATKIWVSCKGVAPHESPTSSFIDHVAVDLDSRTIQIDPVYSTGELRALLFENFARDSWVGRQAW